MNGDHKRICLSDLVSGALIAGIVERAKRAIKDALTGSRFWPEHGHLLRGVHEEMNESLELAALPRRKTGARTSGLALKSRRRETDWDSEMSSRRVWYRTEYGVYRRAMHGAPKPIALSTGRHHVRRINRLSARRGWASSAGTYGEDPLNDLRGMRMSHAAADHRL